MRDLDSLINEVEDTVEPKWKKVLTWLKVKKNIAIVILSTLLLSCFYWIAKVENNVTIKEVVKTVTEAPKMADDYLVLDLSKMEVTKHVETTSSKSGKPIFGVWYKLETPGAQIVNSVYLTIFENIDNLKKNKGEFDKYIELESKKAEKLSKDK